MDKMKRDLMCALTLMLVIGFLVGFEVGCRTTRTNTDGSVEVTEIDREALASIIDLAMAVMEYKQTHSETPEEPAPDIVDTIAQLMTIQSEIHAINADGVITPEETQRLREIYASVSEILKSQGAEIKGQ